MKGGRRFIVRGRVQGVFFRDSTRRIAIPLGLTGHAINLSNGDVEVVAFGDTSALDELESWLAQGPPMSRVADVQAEACAYEECSGFTTG